MRKSVLILILNIMLFLTAKAQFIVHDSIIPPACSCDGRAFISISGGTPPYTIAYNTFYNDTIRDIYNVAVLHNLCSYTTYTIYIFDSNNPTPMTYDVVVGFPVQVNVSVDSIKDSRCNNTCEGELWLTGYNGTPPYNIAVSPGIHFNNTMVKSTSSHISGLCEGSYTVYISDANGCSNMTNVFIGAPQPLSPFFENEFIPTTCTATDGSITVNTENGGTPPYTYHWSNGSTTNVLTNIGVGNYFVTITDSVGCSESASYTLNMADSYLSFYTIDPLCYGYNTGKIFIENVYSSNGMQPPYTYFWNGVPGADSLTNISAGRYTIQVYDAVSGCSIFSFADINQPDSLSTETSISHVMCRGQNNGGISFYNITGGTPGYNLLWSDSTTSWYHYFLNAGQYNVSITDNNGCLYIKSFNINEPDSFYASVSGKDISCFGAEDAKIIVYPSGATAPYYYSLDGESYIQLQDSVVIVGDTGVYSFFLTDAYSCQTLNFNGISVSEPSALTLAVSLVQPTCYNNDGQIELIPGGGIAPYYFNVNNNSTLNSILVGLCQQTYNLQLIDKNGCLKDTTIQLISSNAYPVIKGIVTSNSVVVDSSVVLLFKPGIFGASKMDTVAFMPFSNFEFDQLAPGSYFLKANYIGTTQPILNTYYNQHLYWTDVDTLNITCDDTIQVSLEMMSLPPTTGVCSLSGIVSYVPSKMSKAASEPVPGAEITVEQVPGPTIIKMATTDSTGTYVLNNLPELTSCNLRVDIPGLPMLSTYTNISLSAANPSIVNLNFLVDTTADGGIYVDSALVSALQKDEILISITPNPFHSDAMLTVTLKNPATMNVEIFSSNGNKIFNMPERKMSSGINTLKLNRSNFNSNGVYFVAVHINNTTYIRKIVCN